MKYIRTFENRFENKKIKDNTDNLFTAIYSNNLEKVKELINSGIDLNIRNKDGDGDTALIFAIRQRKIKIVRELINAGADLNLQGKEGCSALIWAASLYDEVFNEDNLVRILIEAGADWNIKHINGGDFLGYLSKFEIERIKSLFPEKYDEYLWKKEAEDKYNL